MGHVHVKVRLSWRRAQTVQALVDTGATFLVLPERHAKRIGVPDALVTQTVELADGTRVRLPQTTAQVRIDGRKAGAVALIVPSGEPLLGVEVLEALGLRVDPIRERLVPKRPYAVRLGGYRRLRRR